MKLTVYRYAKVDSLERLSVEGLQPSRHNMPFTTIGHREHVVYAFLDPLPQEWTHNTKFPMAWTRMKHHLTIPSRPSLTSSHRGGKLLFAIDIDTDVDRVTVADWGPLEELVQDRNGLKGKISSAEAQGDAEVEENLRRIKRTQAMELNRLRKESEISLERYLTESMHYSLPEVIIRSRIPPERVHVASEQPLLIEDLEISNRSRNKHTIIDMEAAMLKYPQLQVSDKLVRWLETYRVQNKSGESTRV